MPTRILPSLIAAAALCCPHGRSQHRDPDRRRRFGRERSRNLPRAGRPVGGPPGRGRLHARGVPPRSGAGPCFLRRAAGEARNASSRTPLTRRWRGSTREWPGELLLVTQNVDDLHERAGSKRLLHMHGELTKGWCLACDERFAWSGPMGEGASCPAAAPRARCGPTSSGSARCPTRWSGSTRRCGAATCSCRSERRARSIPRPASSRLRAIAARRTLEMNLEPSLGSYMFDESRVGTAGELVPAMGG